MTAFDPEVWARTQPHTFYSHWPLASMTKCDFCGIRAGEHPADVPADVDVAKHATKAIAGGLDPAAWPKVEATIGCEACGRDIDRLGGNPDCEVCAAEPALIVERAIGDGDRSEMPLGAALDWLHSHGYAADVDLAADYLREGGTIRTMSSSWRLLPVELPAAVLEAFPELDGDVPPCDECGHADALHRDAFDYADPMRGFAFANSTCWSQSVCRDCEPVLWRQLEAPSPFRPAVSTAEVSRVERALADDAWPADELEAARERVMICTGCGEPGDIGDPTVVAFHQAEAFGQVAR